MRLYKYIIILILMCFSLAELQASHIIKLKDNKHTEKLQSMKLKLSKVFASPNEKYDKLQSRDKLESYYILYNYNELSSSDKKELLSHIDFIEENYIYKIEGESTSVPNDYLFSGQWGFEPVNALKARALATGKGVLIGMVDTGINFLHKDLADNIYINAKEDRNGNGRFDNWLSSEQRGGVYGDIDGIDNDGNGSIDDVVGYDFVDVDGQGLSDSEQIDCDPSDDHGHGTGVAGVMVAINNNGEGVSGVAYNAKLLTARAFNSLGEGESDDIAKSIVYLVNNGAQVINCSFGDKYYSRLIDAALDYAYANNCVIVSSSGNNNWERLHYPSDHSKAISVGAVSKKLEKLFVSNYGFNLTLLAPGEKIVTTDYRGSYREYTGTSFSTPFVSATVAMMLELNPNLKPDEVKTMLEVSAKPISSMEANKEEGAGLLDIYATLKNSEKSKISIDTPLEFQSFVRGKDDEIVITGSVYTPLFDSYEITMENRHLDEGIDKTYEKVISKKQVHSDTLAVFKNRGRSVLVDQNNKRLEFPNGDVLIRLNAKLKNGKTIKRSKLIEIVNDEKLKITSLWADSAFYNNKQGYFINASTNLNSAMKIEADDSVIPNLYSNLDNYGKYHSVFINQDFFGGETQKLKVTLSRRDGQKLTREIEVKKLMNTQFPKLDYSVKSYGFDKHIDLYLYQDNGLKFISNSKLEPDIWDKAELYSFENGAFNKLDEDKEVIFPVGTGELAGEKVILCRNIKRFAVYRMSDKLFKNIVFEDYDLTALGIYDFDKDGNSELIALKRRIQNNDTTQKDSLLIMKYKDFTFKPHFAYAISSSARDFGSYEEGTKFLIDDASNPSQVNFIIGNKYSNLRLLKYADNSIISDEMISIDTTLTEAYQIATADLDGDGKMEILKFCDYLAFPRAYREYPNQATDRIFKLKVYQLTGDKYIENKELEQCFFNLKTNFDDTAFRFSISGGDIDGKKGDEVILTAFPNLYIYKYLDNALVPYFYHTNVLSSTPVVYDIDNNGKVDLSISSENSLSFIELENDSILPPSDLFGYSLNDSEYMIKWRNPVKSIGTELWVNSTKIADIKSNVSSYILKDYANKKGVIFLKAKYENEVLSSASDTINFTISSGANIVEITSNSSYLRLRYDKKIPVSAEPLYFTIRDADSVLSEVKSVLYLSEKEYLLAFNSPLKNGEYTLITRSFFDAESNVTVAGEYTFNLSQVSDDKILYFNSLNVIKSKPLVLELTFSEKVSDNALDKNNYELEPHFDINNISRKEGDDSTVVIEFNPANSLGALGRTYSISSTKVIAKSGNAMKNGIANKLAFVLTAEDIYDTFVYPNPVNFTSDKYIYFANLPNRAIINIYTLEGVKLATLQENDGNGGCQWDGIKSDGERISTGIYLYQVEDYNNNKSELNKLVIIK